MTASPHRRILFVNHIAQLSGGEIALARLIDAVGDRIDAHVVLGEDGPLVGRLREAGATVHVLEMAPEARDVRKDTVRLGGVGMGPLVQIARYTWRLRALIRRLEPDLVHTNSLKAALYGGAAARLARRKVIWHVRDRIELDYLPRPAVALVRALAWLVPHGIIANSAATLASVPTKLPSEVIHSTVVYDALRHDGVERRPTSDGVQRIGVMGRLAPWKGQHIFLQAFAEAFPEEKIRAVIIGAALFGEDDYAASLLDLAEDLGIADRVDFRGFREDVWAELAELDVLVHSSVTPEPFGQVVIEGMAAGIPVIATNAGGPAEIVTHDRDGLLVEPGDVDELALAMRRLIEDPFLAGRMADRAHATVQRFGPEETAVALLQVYESVIAGRRSSIRSRNFQS